MTNYVQYFVESSVVATRRQLQQSVAMPLTSPFVLQSTIAIKSSSSLYARNLIRNRHTLSLSVMFSVLFAHERLSSYRTDCDPGMALVPKSDSVAGFRTEL